MEVVRVLLTESQIEAEATNFKGRNPLHILANFANDNAVAIFDLFLECMPNYPLDKMDSDGNTGNLQPCKLHARFCPAITSICQLILTQIDRLRLHDKGKMHKVYIHL